MCGESRLYGSGETDLITKTWLRFNKVSIPWKWGQDLDFKTKYYIHFSIDVQL
jgi:hypothetical protein